MAFMAPGIAKCQALIIPANSYVINNAYLSVGGNFTNNGNFTDNSTVKFSGTTQEINGSVATSFLNLAVLSGSTTTVSTTGHTIRRSILSEGTLAASSNLTLLSSASQTAFVYGSATGSITSIIMQRYLDTGFGYRYISSPFQSTTVGELSDDVDLSASFCRFYRYQEDTVSTGWVKYHNTANVLTPLRGYCANFGTSYSARTIDMTGTVNNGNISLSGLYNHNRTYTLGYHLIGNPYPSPIDWDIAAGWTKTNIDNALYYFRNGDSNMYVGSYSTYINGISSDGEVNNIIAAMQGFFVHVSDGTYPVTGALAVNNNARVTNTNPGYYKTSLADDRLQLRISARYTGLQEDNAIIYFDQDASKYFENTMDALKLFNTDPAVPNLYSFSAGSEKLAINALPPLNDSACIIPLGIKTEKTGAVHFTCKTINAAPLGFKIYLVDAVAGIVQNIDAVMDYNLLLQAGEHVNRFYIVFTKDDLSTSPIAEKQFKVYYSNDKILVYLNLVTGDKADINVFNTIGQKLSTQTISGYGFHEIDKPALPGIYLLNCHTGANNYNSKIFVGEAK
jgi:fibronectin-binding autotransporter adhesin